MKTAIDWALDVIQRAKLPQDVPIVEYQRKMAELRILRNNGVMESSLYCPCAGCTYVCGAPAGYSTTDSDAVPVICPHDSTPLISMTWKQMAEKLSVSMQNMELIIEEQKKAFQYIQDKFNELAEKALTATNRMREAERALVSVTDGMDDMKFLTQTEADELDWWRQFHDAEPFRYAWRMIRELNENSHKGDWQQWKPDKDTLFSEITHHVTKLIAAVDKGNSFAVSEYAADVGNYMLKAIEMYGHSLKQL